MVILRKKQIVLYRRYEKLEHWIKTELKEDYIEK